MLVNKPSGLFVHASKLDRTAGASLQELLESSQRQKLYPVHRLDRPTSGCLIFAKSSLATSYIAKQFQRRTVAKSYIALARGWLKPQCCVAPLSRDKGGERIPTKTVFEPKFRLELPYSHGSFDSLRLTCLEASPITGRMHQIRRHLKSLGHPIVGDTKYGQGPINRLFRQELEESRLFLHCASLRFERLDGVTVEVSARTPASFLKLQTYRI
ncbi:MAG: hypothetical protein HRU19_06660 [Pseudobacteriovorax sp.]|nr:hypothetical protein [Pseudobacteriovorax sp.]